MYFTTLRPGPGPPVRDNFDSQELFNPAWAQSPYLLVPHQRHTFPFPLPLSPFPCFSGAHIKTGGLHKSDARHHPDSHVTHDNHDAFIVF